jgi:hypothetical protein
MAETSGQSTPGDERRRYEQALMRIGRRMQAIGQLLEQDPARLVGKGFSFDPAITGARPVEIDMDELRGWFDPSSARNVGQLLAEYQAELAKSKPPIRASES